MPQTALLNEFWRDVVSISSTAITVVGFVLTVVSLIYAIRQIWKTQSAADAALKAANQAVIESRQSFERYTLANALRYFAEAKLYINDSLWDKASLRLNDLSEQTAQLATVDAEWKALTLELRLWSNTLAQLSTRNSRFAGRKWSDFSIRLQGKIDERHGPFSLINRGQGS
jgi:hypothetical protein